MILQLYHILGYHVSFSLRLQLLLKLRVDHIQSLHQLVSGEQLTHELLGFLYVTGEASEVSRGDEV